jgi:hypothetical protein
MPKERTSLIRASDIGLWAYCQRAWWLARVQGVSHRFPERLEYGTQAHQAHGRAVTRGQQLQRLGLYLLALALLLGGGMLLYWAW